MQAPGKLSGFFMLFLVGLVLAATIVSGCIGDQGSGAITSRQSIRVTGSTTVLPIAELAAEAFMLNNTYADIQVNGGGSGVGVQCVGEGTADIGMSSRDLKPDEMAKYQNLKTTVIAKDGIAVIVHPANTITTLTMAQIRGIYNGSYTNWNQVGGPDLTIVVVGRDSASGTREFFFEKVMAKENFAQGQLEKNSNGAVKQTIAQTPGAIGYVGLGYIDADVKAVGISTNGTAIEPTVDNILTDSYPISRPLILITRGEPTGLVNEYVSFILSEEGQQLVKDEGFIPV
jgi:phosphate transport system substrate-binding protein